MQLPQQTLEVIDKAKRKGFNTEYEITPVMFDGYMNAELAFCNTACAILSMWLRTKDLYVTPAGPAFGGFSYFVANPYNQKIQPHSFGSHKSFEEAWLAGIERALEML